MKKTFIVLIVFVSTMLATARAEETEGAPVNSQKSTETSFAMFDDKALLDGYAQKYTSLAKDIILAMIADDTLSSYKTASAVKIFKEKFSPEVVSREKNIIEKLLLRRLDRSDSAFVDIEIMHVLCVLDRYRYFEAMVPALLRKLDHYNTTVNEIAFNNLEKIIESGSNRPREARIVFNTLRKMLFLSRNRIANMAAPTPRLKQKLKILRWSIKILGNQELKKLPNEVINLL